MVYCRYIVLTKTGAGCPGNANKTNDRTLKEKRAMADHEKEISLPYHPLTKSPLKC